MCTVMFAKWKPSSIGKDERICEVVSELRRELKHQDCRARPVQAKAVSSHHPVPETGKMARGYGSLEWRFDAKTPSWLTFVGLSTKGGTAARERGRKPTVCLLNVAPKRCQKAGKAPTVTEGTWRRGLEQARELVYATLLRETG